MSGNNDPDENHVQSSLNTIIDEDDGTNTATDADLEAGPEDIDSVSDEHTVDAEATPHASQSPAPSSPPSSPEDSPTQSEANTDPETTTPSNGLDFSELKKFLISVLGSSKTYIASIIYGTLLMFSRTIRGKQDSRKGLSGYFYPNSMIQEDQEVLIATNPSRWQAAGPYALAILFILAASLTPIAVYSGWLESYLNARSPSFLVFGQPQYWWVFSGICLVCAFIATIGEIIHRASTWLIVTESHINYRTNPLDRQRQRIALDDINQAKDEFPIPGRFVGMGKISIYTASTEGTELVFTHLKNPGERADMINNQKAKRDGDTDTEVTPEDSSPHAPDE
jgi:hypothetical protein